METKPHSSLELILLHYNISDEMGTSGTQLKFNTTVIHQTNIGMKDYFVI